MIRLRTLQYPFSGDKCGSNWNSQTSCPERRITGIICRLIDSLFDLNHKKTNVCDKCYCLSGWNIIRSCCGRCYKSGKTARKRWEAHSCKWNRVIINQPFIFRPKSNRILKWITRLSTYLVRYAGGFPEWRGTLLIDSIVRLDQMWSREFGNWMRKTYHPLLLLLSIHHEFHELC